MKNSTTDNKNIAFFRLDSSSKIGGGHLYRCLVLARKLAEVSYDIVFICRELQGHLNAEVTSCGYEIKYLTSDQPEQLDVHFDAEQTNRIIEGYDKSYINIILIADHYLLSEYWFYNVRPLVNILIAINDLTNRRLPVDIVVDTSLAANEESYLSWTLPETTLLLGPKFALLEPNFTRYRDESIQLEKVKIKNVLIFFGSTDPKQHVLSTLNTLKSSDLKNTLQWTVLLSDKAEHFSAVKTQLETEFPTSVLTSREVNMAEFLSQFQLVIGANGINAFERCCLGIPAITLNSADNQKYNSATLSQSNAIIHLKEAFNSLERSLVNIIKSLAASNDKYQFLKECALQVCDGQGTDRVAVQILNQQPKPKLIAATNEHLLLLFNWQSNNETRKYSRNTEVPTLGEHTKWYNSTLLNANKKLYFVERNNETVAMVRVDFKTAVGSEMNEVSIIVNPEYRNQGIGNLALNLIRQRFISQPLSAYIQKEHLASIKLFTRNGYEKTSENWYVNSPKKLNKYDEENRDK